MSKFVNELLKDLKENPKTFRDYHGSGVAKGKITICQYGNTRVLSVTRVYIGEAHIPTSYIDNWRLEVAIKKWYATIDLATLEL